MSLYGDYIKERLGDEIIEDANGFATYRFLEYEGLHAVYIVDIYVTREHRKAKYATSLADQVVAIGKEAGCVLLIGSVSTTAKNATDSLRVLLGYGMTFSSCNQDGIIFKKGI